MNRGKHGSRAISKSKNAWKRRGVALLFVLVVVATLSLAVYAFSRSSLSQLAALQAQREIVVQRLLAESAIAFSKAETGHRVSPLSATVPNETLFQRSPKGLHKLDLGDGRIGYFAVVKSLPKPDTDLEFGTRNESAKLNLNSLPSIKRSREQVIAKLMRTPGVNNAIAMGIANRLGIANPTSASTGTPSSASTAERPKRIDDLDDLLEITGVTSSLLYGEDLNRNGILDDNENDGANSLPLDNADGRLDLGWSGDWTVTGAESNIRPDGKPKINLNQTDLVGLYDELATEFGGDFARFIVAWKVAAPIFNDASPISDEQALRDSEIERKNTFEERMRLQLGGDSPLLPQPDGSQSGTSSSKVRAGILLSNQGRKINSHFDLVGCKVQIMIDAKDVVIISPFASDPTSIQRWLPIWEEKTTLNEGPILEGRIDINQASLSTLQTIDGMTESLAASIIKIRENNDLTSKEFSTVAWLLSRGVLTTAQLRQMGAEVTTSGSVFSGIAIGQLASSRTATAIQFTMDARFPPARLTRHVDLAPLQLHQRLPVNK